MTGSSEFCALVVESDPDLREIFEDLLEGWVVRFVPDPWAVRGSPPADADLLVIDEDYLHEHRAERSGGKAPEWLEALAQRLPTIVLRAAAAPRAVNPFRLVLPKPFPVSGFLEFADAVRRAKARTGTGPDGGSP